MSNRLRLVLACLATTAILAPLGWFWQQSLLPSRYSVMDMGYIDYGGGPGASDRAQHAHGGPNSTSVATLGAEADRRADVNVDLTAEKRRFSLKSGREVDGFTLNGESPGPTIRAQQGDLVRVQVRNQSVPDGMTLHWHGVDVPNAMDGVAGVTQDAIRIGETFTYRFVAEDAGTYWYHSHQVSHEQVRRGLFGTLIVTPTNPDTSTRELAAVLHSYQGIETVNGQEGDTRMEASAGEKVRARVVNTDNHPRRVWVTGAPYRVVAVDGTDVAAPTPVTGKSILLTAGGRYDLEIVMPRDGTGVAVEFGGSALLIGRRSPEGRASTAPKATVDLLNYGSPQRLTFDPADPDREFDFVIGRRPGFVRGRPGLWWTVNGHMYPDVPMFMVAEGDVVRMRIENNSGLTHPMHLHGHHAVVLSRNGVKATGSPWWVDSLNVANGESYEVAFLADNPGIWMDHCHNLRHAAEGLVAHVMYAGYTTPFTIGGKRDNEPE